MQIDCIGQSIRPDQPAVEKRGQLNRSVEIDDPVGRFFRALRRSKAMDADVLGTAVLS
jgi:hypothetical protein